MKLQSLPAVILCLTSNLGEIAAQQPNQMVRELSGGSSGQFNIRLGKALATEGAYTVIGAPDTDYGAVDSGVVTVRSSTTGLELFRLQNPNPSTNFEFGASVAISGTRVVVGAMQPSFGGFAYVYDLAGVTPTIPVHVLPNPYPANTDRYGSAVAIQGTRVVVAASTDDTIANDAGSVYVYDIAGATPTVPVLEISDPDATAGDWFGVSMALSGGKLVVGSHWNDSGASNAGSAFVFDLDGASPQIPIWTIRNPTPATNDYFGFSVGISENTVVVAAYADSTDATGAGSAYVYDLASATPDTPVHRLKHPTPVFNDFFGFSVAISGSRVLVGAYADDVTQGDEGSASVFDLTSATPTVPVFMLTNPEPENSDTFGYTVSISGTRAMVAAPYDDRLGTNNGTVYLYELAGATPTVHVALANITERSTDDQFGWSVAVSGTWMVVSERNDGTGLALSGIVYVYDLSSPTLYDPAFTLLNPSPAAYDYFGYSVAIDGNIIAVGAHGDDTNATNAGSVYVYDIASGSPTVPVATLNNPVQAGDNFYGSAVAVSGSRVVVGAYRDDTGATDAGRAYVYDIYSPSGPSGPLPVVLAKTTPVASDYFGYAVSISGTRVVVGAYQDDTASANAGAAYVYDIADSPTEIAVLTNPGPIAADAFGYSVGISGTRVVAGAIYDNTGNNQSGSSYVYDLAGGSPTTPVVTIANPTPGFTDWFGSAVAISGSRVVVAAVQDSTGAGNAGSAYVFDVSGANPSAPVATFNNPLPGENDKFGTSVAIDGLIVAVGAPYDDTANLDTGSVYIYDYVPETDAPTGGTMTLNPESPVDAGADLTVNFTDWSDESPPLTYALSIGRTTVSAAGLSNSRVISAPLLPGTYMLTGLITDALGNRASVRIPLTVMSEVESWRNQYFGTTIESGPAADIADPDGDGFDNRFEYTAGLDPTNASSRFLLRIEKVEGQPNQQAIIFSPLMPGRAYQVKCATDLVNPIWEPIGSASTSNDGSEKTITDDSATASRKFYVVEIAKP